MEGRVLSAARLERGQRAACSLRICAKIGHGAWRAARRRRRNWNDFNQVLRDRRTDVYDEMLGADVKRGWY